MILEHNHAKAEPCVPGKCPVHGSVEEQVKRRRAPTGLIKAYLAAFDDYIASGISRRDGLPAADAKADAFDALVSNRG